MGIGSKCAVNVSVSVQVNQLRELRAAVKPQSAIKGTLADGNDRKQLRDKFKAAAKPRSAPKVVSVDSSDRKQDRDDIRAAEEPETPGVDSAQWNAHMTKGSEKPTSVQKTVAKAKPRPSREGGHPTTIPSLARTAFACAFVGGMGLSVLSVVKRL